LDERIVLAVGRYLDELGVNPERKKHFLHQKGPLQAKLKIVSPGSETVGMPHDTHIGGFVVYDCREHFGQKFPGFVRYFGGVGFEIQDEMDGGSGQCHECLAEGLLDFLFVH
jgi:hypothetical protein